MRHGRAKSEDGRCNVRKICAQVVSSEKYSRSDTFINAMFNGPASRHDHDAALSAAAMAKSSPALMAEMRTPKPKRGFCSRSATSPFCVVAGGGGGRFGIERGFPALSRTISLTPVKGGGSSAGSSGRRPSRRSCSAANCAARSLSICITRQARRRCMCDEAAAALRASAGSSGRYAAAARGSSSRAIEPMAR